MPSAGNIRWEAGKWKVAEDSGPSKRSHIFTFNLNIYAQTELHKIQGKHLVVAGHMLENLGRNVA